ncbi:MAG TPA: hypothetical protein VFQ22_10550 [Longimicrobiales bacterium]|nr:hypothetical protein [Longimicrobiales bacterium]
MARGYCSHCAQLVPIAPGEVDPRGGGRERVWRPLAHRDAQGRQCVGIHEAAGNVEFSLGEAPTPGRN